LVGDISDGVKRELESLGYKTERVYAGNVAAKAAGTIDDFATKISGEIPKNVIVGSMDDLSFTAPAGNWIAHMPEPLLYVRQNEIPESTFAMYLDPETGFGWEIQQSGHSLSFVPTGNIPLVIAAGPFAHMGKHSPLI
jgi:hypothetical protein